MVIDHNEPHVHTLAAMRWSPRTHSLVIYPACCTAILGAGYYNRRDYNDAVKASPHIMARCNFFANYHSICSFSEKGISFDKRSCKALQTQQAVPAVVTFFLFQVYCNSLYFNSGYTASISNESERPRQLETSTVCSTFKGAMRFWVSWETLVRNIYYVGHKGNDGGFHAKQHPTHSFSQTTCLVVQY